MQNSIFIHVRMGSFISKYCLKCTGQEYVIQISVVNPVVRSVSYTSHPTFPCSAVPPTFRPSGIHSFSHCTVHLVASSALLAAQHTFLHPSPAFSPLSSSLHYTAHTVYPVGRFKVWPSFWSILLSLSYWSCLSTAVH